MSLSPLPTSPSEHVSTGHSSLGDRFDEPGAFSFSLCQLESQTIHWTTLYYRHLSPIAVRHRDSLSSAFLFKHSGSLHLPDHGLYQPGEATGSQYVRLYASSGSNCFSLSATSTLVVEVLFQVYFSRFPQLSYITQTTHRP